MACLLSARERWERWYSVLTFSGAAVFLAQDIGQLEGLRNAVVRQLEREGQDPEEVHHAECGAPLFDVLLKTCRSRLRWHYNGLLEGQGVLFDE